MLQLDLPTGTGNVAADEVALRVVVEHDAGRDFRAVGTGLLGSIEVERVIVGMLVELHRTNPRSGKALGIVVRSAKGTTPK